MNRFLDIITIMMFSGFFYYTFEGVFNSIFTPQTIKENMQDVNNDNIRDGYILGFGFCSYWMILLGAIIGVGMFGIYCIPIFQKYFMLPVYCLISGITITSVELGFGSLFNKITKLRIWNYSNEKLNYKGHISLFRSLAWIALGIPIWYLCKLLFNAIWL